MRRGFYDNLIRQPAFDCLDGSLPRLIVARLAHFPDPDFGPASRLLDAGVADFRRAFGKCYGVTRG